MKNIPSLLNSLFVSLIFLLSFGAEAQEYSADSNQQEQPKPVQNRGIVLQQKNFEQFKSLVIPELHSLVKSDLLQMDVVKELNFQSEGFPKVPYEYMQAETSEQNLKSAFLNPAARKSSFALFFDPQEFNGNPQTFKPDEILWNTYSSIFSQKHFKAVFSSKVLTSDSSSSKFPVQGTVERIFSFSNQSERALPQLFREKITILRPEALSPYSWLSFRFISKNPEFVWTYSPAINQVRQMSSSNRSDPVSFGLPEVDDFFVWSGNPNSVEARVVSAVRAVSPFSSPNYGRLFDLPSGCLGIEDSGMSSMQGVRWNFEDRRFSNGAAWLPSRAVFAPRDLIKVQLHSLDPYYKDSIQTLYIDKELMVPVYKVSYNSVGRRRKIVIGGYGIAASADQSRKMIYPSYSVSINYDTREAHVIDYSQISNCSSKNLKDKLVEFEPKSLIQVKEESSEKSKKS